MYNSVIFSKCTELCTYHHNPFQPISIVPFYNSCLFAVSPHSHLQPQATTGLLSLSVDLFFLDLSCNGIIQYPVLCAWLLSLTIMFLRPTHVSVLLIFQICPPTPFWWFSPQIQAEISTLPKSQEDPFANLWNSQCNSLISATLLQIFQIFYKQLFCSYIKTLFFFPKSSE